MSAVCGGGVGRGPVFLRGTVTTANNHGGYPELCRLIFGPIIIINNDDDNRHHSAEAYCRAGLCATVCSFIIFS